MKSCVVYYSHFLNEDILAHYYKIRNECSAHYDVFFAYDNTRHDFINDPRLEKEELFLFGTNNLLKYGLENTTARPLSIIPGNHHYIHYDFVRSYPTYKYYWRIDYDVFYTGNWGNLISSFQNSNADLLATCIFDYEQMPKWSWWHSFHNPSMTLLQKYRSGRTIESLRRKILYSDFFFTKHLIPKAGYLTRCLLPVYRLSLHGVNTLTNLTKRGWRGHDEVLLPTLIKTEGLNLEDMGGTGRYAQYKNQENLYTVYHDESRITGGTFRAFPVQVINDVDTPNMLFHPVKKELYSLVERWT